MPVSSFDGRVVVVTGAARGLGRALAEGFARSGARVALVDRDPIVGEVATELGAEHVAHVIDLADVAALPTLAARVRADLGRVDVLVNNAGVSVAGRFTDIPLEDFEWLFDVNFRAVVHGCRAFLPHLAEQPEAHIVNVASSFAWLGFPGKSAYSASKAAVRAFSESLRAEHHGTGLGVTVLFPGPLDTDLVRRGRATDADQRDAEARFLAARAIPLEHVVRKTLRGIRRDRARVVCGLDYVLIDAFVRFAPSLALAAVTRMSKRMPF